MKSNIEHIAEAQRLKDAGQVALAERICREVISRHPTDASALHLLGAIMHLKGQPKDAILYLEKAVLAQPNNSSYLVTLGGNLAIAGRMDEATECFRRAVAANPGAVDAQYNLGLALKHRKEFGTAEQHFLKALDIAPGHVDALANLGVVVLLQGRPNEAKAIFSRALTLSPVHPLSLTNLATILVQEGKQSHAEILLRALEPNAPETSLYQLASVYDHLSNNALAISALRHLVSKYPKSAEANAALATGLVGNFQMEEGISFAKIAIGLDENCASAWCSLGMAYAHSGLFKQAYDALTKTINLTKVVGPRVMRDLMLPCIMGTRDEVLESRTVFEQNLDRLIADDLVSANPLGEIGFTYFYLAYHGENDVNLQKKIAYFYKKSAPSINYVAPHCAPAAANKRRPGPIRLGFYSHYVSTHSVSFSFAKIIEALSASDAFEVYLVTDASLTAEGVEEMYPSLAGRAIQTARDVRTAQASLAALELDVLVYLDIGMDPLSFLLAFSRLAPVQCVMGGHPVTTGIPTIDYFLSPGMAEPPDAQQHYSETLIQLEHGGFIFKRMELPSILKSRRALGMPDTPRVYTCPMTLQKIHPDFDEAIERILSYDTEGSIVFFESAQSAEWGRLLRERFDRTIDPKLRNRIVFMPWVRDQADLLSIIAQSDVILDPFHFGMGTTGIHVFSAGTPFVTKPSSFMRGRVGYMYANLLGVTECIAEDVSGYASTAVRIANTAKLRERIKQTILANNDRFFDNHGAATELVSALKKLADQHI